MNNRTIRNTLLVLFCAYQLNNLLNFKFNFYFIFLIALSDI